MKGERLGLTNLHVQINYLSVLNRLIHFLWFYLTSLIENVICKTNHNDNNILIFLYTPSLIAVI